MTDAFHPVPGVAETLEPGLRRILAPNPSPMTYRGTNTYLLGTDEVAIIDPGPYIPDHLQAILRACDGARITDIIVTHSHLDHSALAHPLADKTGATIRAFGGPQDGRSAVMAQLAQSGFTSGGEGVDHGFRPHAKLRDGDQIDGSGWTLDVLHTPGHLGNHIVLAWGDVCFTGDHVMGWASSLVSPPDGDLTDFMASCARLQKRHWRIFYPGHGAAVTNPTERLRWLIYHRRSREASILQALSGGPATAAEITSVVYTDTPPALQPAAARNVLAHLVDLATRNEIANEDPIGPETRFHLI